MKLLFLNYATIPDDRANLSPADKVVLIIEDDPNFAHILLKQANIKGFKCLTAATGEDGLVLALNSIHKPLFWIWVYQEYQVNRCCKS
jgi:hypothetical protein